MDKKKEFTILGIFFESGPMYIGEVYFDSNASVQCLGDGFCFHSFFLLILLYLLFQFLGKW